VHKTVLIGVMLSGFFGMIGSVQRMSVRDVGMVTGLFVIARLVVVGCFAVMFRRLFMVLRSLVMMLRSLVFHCEMPFFTWDEMQEHQGVYRGCLRME